MQMDINLQLKYLVLFSEGHKLCFICIMIALKICVDNNLPTKTARIVSLINLYAYATLIIFFTKCVYLFGNRKMLWAM